MKTRDHGRLVAQLQEEYTKRSPRSAAAHREAEKWLIDGGSHLARLFSPFPFRYTEAHGAYVYDIDGHQILDFWQGHFANILGHNPPEITQVLAEAFRANWGLQSGFVDELQTEVAALLSERTGAERVRFTTSGSLATMYAIILARAYTHRNIVLKISGGWHGAQPWALKGIQPRDGSYEHLESEGLPAGIGGEVLVTRYNDADELKEVFRLHGDRIACFILEPWVGAGGCIPARPEYLKTARELTTRYGAVLIFDEVIAGFRFRAGDLGGLYGVRPDLATFGKIIGGGMPLAAVAGRADIMQLCGRQNGKRRVRFDGGTYSAHPATLLAAKTMLQYLIAHEGEIYSRLAMLGEKARRGIEDVFAQHGIRVCCTGYGNSAVPGSSLAAVHFPRDLGEFDRSSDVQCPDQAMNPDLYDLVLQEQVLKLGLLLEDVHVSHGLGSLSTAHSEADVERLLTACGAVAERIARA